ncbi:hypothetical protein PHLH7_38960 [Pseudomonas sp. Ost2]|nr:hypothetical protein PHLH7_38960 [Pseudomonas sp. Ost2]
MDYRLTPSASSWALYSRDTCGIWHLAMHRDDAMSMILILTTLPYHQMDFEQQ